MKTHNKQHCFPRKKNVLRLQCQWRATLKRDVPEVCLTTGTVSFGNLHSPQSNSKTGTQQKLIYCHRIERKRWEKVKTGIADFSTPHRWQLFWVTSEMFRTQLKAWAISSNFEVSPAWGRRLDWTTSGNPFWGAYLHNKHQRVRSQNKEVILFTAICKKHYFCIWRYASFWIRIKEISVEIPESVHSYI